VVSGHAEGIQVGFFVGMLQARFDEERLCPGLRLDLGALRSMGEGLNKETDLVQWCCWAVAVPLERTKRCS